MVSTVTLAGTARAIWLYCGCTRYHAADLVVCASVLKLALLTRGGGGGGGAKIGKRGLFGVPFRSRKFTVFSCVILHLFIAYYGTTSNKLTKNDFTKIIKSSLFGPSSCCYLIRLPFTFQTLKRIINQEVGPLPLSFTLKIKNRNHETK